MKIIYFGFNALSSCLDALIANEDITIQAVYTGEEGSHTDQIYQLVDDHELNVTDRKPKLDEMEYWVKQGVDCFICAEYSHKVPIPKDLKYTINIHPTLLPEGRGQTPLPQVILKSPQHAGVTLHKMTDKFDEGDIIINEALEVSDDETFDSLHMKVFLTAPKLLQQVIENPDHYMSHAKPQTKGSNWLKLGLNEQSVTWSMTTDEITLKSRAFGSLGVQLTINDEHYFMTTVHCSKFEHGYMEGEVIQIDDFKLTIACKDGMVIIPRDSLFKL